MGQFRDRMDEELRLRAQAPDATQPTPTATTASTKNPLSDVMMSPPPCVINIKARHSRTAGRRGPIRDPR